MKPARERGGEMGRERERVEERGRGYVRHA